MGARVAAAVLGLAIGACSSSSARELDEPPRIQAAAWRALLTAGEARVIVTAADLEAARAASRTIGSPRLFERIPACAGRVTAEQLRTLERMAGVRTVAMDEGGEGHLMQALPLAGFEPVAAAGLDGTGITVAVIDSGIDRGHPDLAGAVVDEACFCGSNCCPGGVSQAFGEGSAADDSGHGTHVAGVIASRGVAVSPAGGAPAVSLIAIKVLSASNAFCCTSDVIAALDWLLTEHPEVDVVNMSFGANGLYDSDCDDDVFASPIAVAAQALIDRGAILVASSGNNGDAAGMTAPACVRDVVSVGAVWDEDIGPEAILCNEPMTAPDRIACFSNASPTLDVLAPGALIQSAWPDGMVRGRAGTSQSAPMVSACAALLRQAHRQASVGQLSAALRESPTVLDDARNGLSFPRLDCDAARRALDGMFEDGGMDAGADAGSDPSALEDAAADDASSGDASAGEAGSADAAVEDAASDAGAIPDGGTMVPDGSLEPMLEAGQDGGVIDAAIAEGSAELVAGGGGCSCRAAGARDATPQAVAALLGLGLVLARCGRRAANRRQAASRQHAELTSSS